MDNFNTNQLKIHLKHETRVKLWVVSGWTSGGFCWFSSYVDSSSIFQFRLIRYDTLHGTFIFHKMRSCKWCVIRALMNKLGDVFFKDITYFWNHNIFVLVSNYFENINMNLVQIVMGPIWWPPRMTSIVQKKMYKGIRCNLLKTNIIFKVT